MKMVLKIKFLIIPLLFLVSHLAMAQTGLNAGFVNGLWYSKTPFFAGDEVRIYTVIQNQSGFDIIGTVHFSNNDQPLGQSDFSIVNGRLIEKWTDWKVSQGENIISIKISNAKKVEIGKEPEAIELTANTLFSEKYDVDLDTDGDGIGDRDDLDDDGDGYSDEEENKIGSNSLVFDKPVDLAPSTAQQEDVEKIITDESNKDNTIFEDVIEKTTELANVITEKTIEIVDNTKEFLEEQKDKIDEELEQEEKEEILKDAPTIDENENPYVATILGNIPELKEIYGFLLSVLIYTLNSWWILLGLITLLLYFIWKVIKRKFRRRF